MGARISKFPPIRGMSFDLHDVKPPSVPPPPPAPPNPAPIPVHGWLVNIINPVSGVALTGKWAWSSVTTESLGDILHTHDWGPLQPHAPLPPILVTPSLVVRLVSSSTKYWLPAFSVQEPVDGTFPGGSKPVAISTPAYFIGTQNCQDYFPSLASMSFQLVSTRWCGFTWGDVIAGGIGVVADAITGAITNAAGDMIPESLGGDVANAILGHAIGAAVNALDAWGPKGGPLGDFGKSVRAVAGVFAIGWGSSEVAAHLLSPMIGDLAEGAANEVGEYGQLPGSSLGPV
jgi:hypothetical protein